MSLESDQESRELLQQFLVSEMRPLEDFHGLDHAQRTVTEWILLPIRFPQFFSDVLFYHNTIYYLFEAIKYHSLHINHAIIHIITWLGCIA